MLQLPISGCHCQHNCHSLYNRCAGSSCSSWLSFITVIFQAHLGATCSCVSCMKSYLLSRYGPQLSHKYRINIRRQISECTNWSVTAQGRSVSAQGNHRLSALPSLTKYHIYFSGCKGRLNVRCKSQF